jgi:Tfp pilus assembly protein PilW
LDGNTGGEIMETELTVVTFMLGLLLILVMFYLSAWERDKENKDIAKQIERLRNRISRLEDKLYQLKDSRE